MIVFFFSSSSLQLSLIRAYENKAKQQKLLAEESKREIIHKLDIVNEYGKKVINPMKSFWDKERDNLVREMEPELKALEKIMPRRNSRVTRSVIVDDSYERRSSIWEEMTSPITFEWVVKDLDGGEIEFIIRNVEAKKVPSAIIKELSSLWSSTRASYGY